MKRRLPALLILVALLVAPALSHGQDAKPRTYYPNQKTFGLGLQAAFPYSDLGEEANTGYGVAFLADYNIVPIFSLVGDIGWNQFGGKSGYADLDVWEFNAGGRLNLYPFFIGGEVGWYSEVDNVSWVPSLGLRFEKFEISFRWKAAGTQAWTTVRAGFYFF